MLANPDDWDDDAVQREEERIKSQAAADLGEWSACNLGMSACHQSNSPDDWIAPHGTWKAHKEPGYVAPMQTLLNNSTDPEADRLHFDNLVCTHAHSGYCLRKQGNAKLKQ